MWEVIYGFLVGLALFIQRGLCYYQLKFGELGHPYTDEALQNKVCTFVSRYILVISSFLTVPESTQSDSWNFDRAHGEKSGQIKYAENLLCGMHSIVLLTCFSSCLPTKSVLLYIYQWVGERALCWEQSLHPSEAFVTWKRLETTVLLWLFDQALSSLCPSFHCIFIYTTNDIM